MEKFNHNNSSILRSPLSEFTEAIVTSTPLMKSDIGRKLIKKQFLKNLKNLSNEVSSLESMVNSLDLENPETTASPHEVTNVFVFKKDSIGDSPVHQFRTPKAITPETLARFNQLFSASISPKLKKKRIRL